MRYGYGVNEKTAECECGHNLLESIRSPTRTANFYFQSHSRIKFMRLLIDGYNVLHQSGLLGKGSGGVWLERGRKKLLDLLRNSLDPTTQLATQVVFDAYSSSSITTEITSYQEIKVHFSLGYENADELIEKLIREHHAPKSLTVVSSDHRIQRCAKAHRCRIFDSAAWLDELPQRQIRNNNATRIVETPREQAASQGLSNYEVQLWLKEFGIAENSAERNAEVSANNEPLPAVSMERVVPAVVKGPRGKKNITPLSPKKQAQEKPKAKSSGQPKRPNKTVSKQRPVELKSDDGKKPNKKNAAKRGEKKDLPRARKRAARPLPDGYKFPEVGAAEE